MGKLKKQTKAISFVGALAALFIFALAAQAHVESVSLDAKQLKTLSQKEIKDYLSGKGMGLAKAAELHHYPGPKHVLTFAKDLDLTKTQEEKSQHLFDEMKSEAILLGHKLIDKESEIEALFASQIAKPKALSALLTEAAKIKGQLRFAHLKAHLAQKDLLSPAQVKAYDRLRGYDDNQQGEANHKAHH